MGTENNEHQAAKEGVPKIKVSKTDFPEQSLPEICEILFEII